MMEEKSERVAFTPQPMSPMMRLRLWLYPHRRYFKWLRLVARLQMRVPLAAEHQWHFCRWVSLLTTDPDEQVLWRMPGTSLRYCLDLNETIQMSLYYRNGFQPEVMDWVRRCLSPDALFLDGGANIGIHSLIAGEYYREQLGTPTRPYVYAFEPNPRILSQLERNIHQNGLEAFISVHPLAVSDQDEWTSFYLSGQDNSTSSSLASLGPGHQQTGELVRVRTVNLCSFIRAQINPPRVGLIKLDIEGAELLALRGARELLVQDQPALIFEVYPELMQAFGYTFDDTRAFVRELGYTIQRILPNGKLVELNTGPWPTNVQYGDVICFPRGRGPDHAL